MLTKITIRNFKVFKDVEIPLDNGVVFIGPNNSGKTSALQALSLWHTGLRKCEEKYLLKGVAGIPKKRPGVAVGRMELTSLPVSETNLIWHNRKVRSAPNENIRIDLIVEGVSDGKSWKCGLEFDYSNLEGIFCRPLRDSAGSATEIPDEALKVKLAFLPSMSGLVSEEALIQGGRINVLIGQGQTAEVLRNICHRVYTKNKSDWKEIVSHIEKLFGVTVNDPVSLESRGIIVMDYQKTGSSTKFDLPSSGRGMQQVLLLLAYLYDNESGTVLLLDEPDAHLEIIRQREIYDLLVDEGGKRQAQIIVASHSEVLLNKAAQRKTAIAFVGKPHRLTEGKTDEVLKSLNEVEWSYYFSAEKTGWILYLEGESDLKILKEFATVLEHPADKYLQASLVKFLGNDRPKYANKHFYALREAKPNLVGLLIMDRLQNGNMADEPGLKKTMWNQREVENYLCNKTALLSFAEGGLSDDLIGMSQKKQRTEAMEEAIHDLEGALQTVGKPKAFSKDIKASNEFLVPLFKNFAKKINPSIPEEAPHILSKRDFYFLVKHIPKNEIDEEITEKLNFIVEVAGNAEPYGT